MSVGRSGHDVLAHGRTVKPWVYAAALVGVCAGLCACGDDDANDWPDGGAGSDASSDASSGDGDGDGDRDADVEPDAQAGDGDGDGDGDGGPIPGCPELQPNAPPQTLSCTGLYRDIERKRLASGVRVFKPAVELWSDGADKTRWILLPEGTQIDVTDRDAWVFPVGTKFFKEFKWKGTRVETRLFWKIAAGRWVRTAYRWNDDETEAARFGGGDVQVAGDTYYIPSAVDCDKCHKGRADRALGFESVLLGLEGAQGVTLADLVDEGLLSEPDYPTQLTLGDDGTGKGAAALGWLHVNCGVSCHNGFSASEAYRTGLRLRLSAAELEGVEGGSLVDTDARRTTLLESATTPRWSGSTRVVPGAPDDSLLFSLLSMRDPANMRDQMPPIASRVVDIQGSIFVYEWISAMPAGEP